MNASDRRAGLPPRWAQPRTGGVALLALVIVLAPLGLPNNYFYDVAILVGLNAIVCVGLNLLIGYAGQISLGHAGFYALSAYTSAILTSRFGWPPGAALVVAIGAAGLVAYVVGRPILRLKGHYLAMATLGLGIIISIVIATEDRITGGPDGMAVPPLALLGFPLAGERVWYWVVGVTLVVAVWLALNLIDSPVGRVPTIESALRLSDSPVAEGPIPALGGDTVSVFVLPPSIAELERRLHARGHDAPEVIEARMARSRDEISHWAEYDYVLVNDDLEATLARLVAIVTAERLRRERQPALNDIIRGLNREFESR